MISVLRNYTDEELFRRFKYGDMDAFEQIYARYSPGMIKGRQGG